MLTWYNSTLLIYRRALDLTVDFLKRKIFISILKSLILKKFISISKISISKLKKKKSTFQKIKILKKCILKILEIAGK